MLYDPQHLLTELYAISNVPTVVWIDEVGTGSPGPSASAHGTDLFAEFTGIEAGPHLDQRAAVGPATGTVPLDSRRRPGGRWPT